MFFAEVTYGSKCRQAGEAGPGFQAALRKGCLHWVRPGHACTAAPCDQKEAAPSPCPGSELPCPQRWLQTWEAGWWRLSGDTPETTWTPGLSRKGQPSRKRGAEGGGTRRDGPSQMADAAGGATGRGCRVPGDSCAARGGMALSSGSVDAGSGPGTSFLGGWTDGPGDIFVFVCFLKKGLGLCH